MDVVILGNGGHGRDVEDIADALGLFVEYLDDKKGLPTDTPLTAGQVYSIGVWDPKVRAALDRPSDPAPPLIHPSAHLGKGVHLSHGVVVGAGAKIGPDVQLGRHVHIGMGASLTRCTVGDYTTISNDATILGDVTIGSRVIVGGNATVINLRSVGDDAIVGMAAAVVTDIPAKGIAYGNPARVKGFAA